MGSVTPETIRKYGHPVGNSRMRALYLSSATHNTQHLKSARAKSAYFVQCGAVPMAKLCLADFIQTWSIVKVFGGVQLCPMSVPSGYLWGPIVGYRSVLYATMHMGSMVTVCFLRGLIRQPHDDKNATVNFSQCGVCANVPIINIFVQVCRNHRKCTCDLLGLFVLAVMGQVYPFEVVCFGTWRCSGRIPLPYHPETADDVERTEAPTWRNSFTQWLCVLIEIQWKGVYCYEKQISSQ
jgi:hypothetical protein